MADYVTLLGSEQVQNAGYKMQGAAEQMDRAASQIDVSLNAFIVNLEEVLRQDREARITDMQQYSKPGYGVAGLGPR